MRRAMTWVYWDPKSRIRIFECLGGAEIVTALVVRLRNSVLAGRIVRLPLPRTERPLPRYASLELVSDLGRVAFLKWIDTATQHQRGCAADRQGLHSCILGSERVIARRYTGNS